MKDREESGNCGGEGGDGCEDGAQVSATGPGAERVAARRHGGGRGRTRSWRSGKRVRELLEVQRRAGSQDGVRVLAAALCGSVRGRAVAHVAAASEELAGDGRAGQGSVLRAATPAGAVGCVRLHAHGRAGRHHPGAEFSAPDLSLRADVLELGSGDGVLFGELREPVRRTPERGLGTGESAAAASDRSTVDGGEQHERLRRSSPSATRGCCAITGWRGKRRRRGMGTRTAMWSSDIIASSGRWRRS